jgi:poly(U)-specific endoribonuclease
MWGPEKKDVSSIFIGTSPEFELALYTLCFVAGAEENIVTVAGYELKIRCAAAHGRPVHDLDFGCGARRRHAWP